MTVSLRLPLAPHNFIVGHFTCDVMPPAGIRLTRLTRAAGADLPKIVDCLHENIFEQLNNDGCQKDRLHTRVNCHVLVAPAFSWYLRARSEAIPH